MTAQTLNPGDAIDRYEVVGVIGQGGMAAVVEVRHRDLGTRHALKVLQINAPSLHERLLQEGRMQASIADPHICRVTDVVRVGGAPALVMELVEGPSLEALLASYHPNVVQIDHLARRILAGVRAAHAAGLVHRDLKPANVLVDVRDGRVIPKVADFGLARALDDSIEARGGVRTRSGTTMGTPTFMAPEQFRSARNADARSDLFSLGAILYELVSGIPAFSGDDLVEIYEKTKSGDYRPLSQIAPQTPERMIAAIDGALHPDPQKRWRDCDEMLRAWVGNVPDAEVDDAWEGAQLHLVRSLAPRGAELTSSITFAGPEVIAAVAPPSVHAAAAGGGPTAVPVPASSSSRRRWLGAASIGVGLLGLASAAVVLAAVLGAGALTWSAEAPTPAPERATAPAEVDPVAEVPPEPAPAAPAEPPLLAEPPPSAAPAPAPRPRSAPPAPASPTGATVAVEGVDRAWLVGPSGRHKPGEVPPGQYDVMVFFEPAKATQVLSITVGAGDRRTVRCDAALKACR